jgi:hypothetical protein
MISRSTIRLATIALALSGAACHTSPPASTALVASSPTTPRPSEPGFDDVVRDIASKACPSADAEVCAWAQGFLAGDAPALPAEGSWTLGTSSRIGDDGKKVGKARYVVLATSAGPALKVGVMTPVTENDEEERVARAAVEGFRAGAIDPKNPFIAFIESQQGRIQWVEAKPKGRGLELTSPHTGPGEMEVRARGDTLYFCQLEFGAFGGDFDMRPAFSLGSAPKAPLERRAPPDRR